MKILVTGAGGFVGHHTIEHFLKNTDWSIVGVDSWRHKGDPLRLRHLLQNRMYQDRLRIYTLDLAQSITERLVEEIGHIDVALNIASESHVDRSIEDPVPFVKNNVALALTIAEYCRQVNVSKLIHCSTDEVFGPANSGHFHTEDETHLPSNPYSASKAAQEDIFYSYWRCYGIPYIRTNCMNMIGERQDAEKFIPLCIAKIRKEEMVYIHGSADEIGSRMYLHARNLADAWMFLIQNTEASLYKSTSEDVQRPDAYNIVGEKELTNLEIACLISTFMDKGLRYQYLDFHSARPGHDRRYALDGSRMAALGWKAPVPLIESLRKTVAWTLKKENSIWLK